jgi:uncharacterized protein
MTRELAWRRLDAPGFEVCRLTTHSSGGEACGVTLGGEDGAWFSFRWRVAWDDAWHTRHVHVETLLGPPQTITLEADGAGHWGEARVDLAGCLDIDLAATPLTNTLPIRRLGALAPGERRAIRVAWLALPRFELRPVAQCYTCLARDDSGATWRYEDERGSRYGGITTDAEGLVLDYPGLFQRVEPPP